MNKKTFVTKSFLPPVEEYEEYVKQIWANGQLTNRGPLFCEFEDNLKKYLNVDDVHFVSNGTIALQVALRSLDIMDGEIITTPFSYVATTSSILWERCEPVFVDIEPDTYCIDVSRIEAAITERTKAIMPVHVFGFPCDVQAIDDLAKKYNLKIIYDAAHSFGVKLGDKSLLDYGDISITSFHSTKLFHTIEGGCLVARDEKISSKIELIKRFGHDLDNHIMPGINAKASEFQAAMGLCNLKYIDGLIVKRKAIFELYSDLLKNYYKVPSISEQEGYEHNYAYYPILFKDENHLIECFKALAEKEIYPRRYFYPSLNEIPYINSKQSCPVSEDTSRRIACLPLFDSLSEDIVKNICKILVDLKDA